MKYQAFFLCLIILISLLISPVRNYISNGADPAKNIISAGAEKRADNQSKNEVITDTSGSLFLAELYIALDKKTIATGQDLTGEIAKNLATISQNLSLGANFFSELNSENKSDNNSQSNQTALISEAKVDPPVPVCHFDESTFNSKAIVVKYLDSDKDIFELNPEKRWPIASLSKLMVSLISFEKIDPEKEIIMSKEAVAVEGEAGSFKADETFTVGDLIKAMLVASSNDAAMALTESFGTKDFIDEMQRKAVELKMFQTTYLEPTGLSFINQSTADDLVKLVNYIYQKYPSVFEISRSKEVKIFELKSKKLRTIMNVDKFAGEENFLGGKTGYIDEAGRNFIGIFNINDKKVLIIILGADNSFEEAEKLKGIVQICI